MLSNIEEAGKVAASGGELKASSLQTALLSCSTLVHSLVLSGHPGSLLDLRALVKAVVFIKGILSGPLTDTGM